MLSSIDKITRQIHSIKLRFYLTVQHPGFQFSSLIWFFFVTSSVYYIFSSSIVIFVNYFIFNNASITIAYSLFA